MDQLIIKGARENNLKNIDITLPKNKLIESERAVSEPAMSADVPLATVKTSV